LIVKIFYSKEDHSQKLLIPEDQLCKVRTIIIQFTSTRIVKSSQTSHLVKKQIENNQSKLDFKTKINSNFS